MKMLLSLMMTGSLYAGAILSVTPSPVQVTAGASLQLDVTISGAPDLVGFQFDVLFPSFLTLDNVVESGYFAVNGVSWSPGVLGPGVVSGVFDVLVGPGIPDPDTLISLFFTATGGGSGDVTLAQIMLLDSSFGEIPVDAMYASTVTSLVTPVTPSPEPRTWLLVLTGVGLAAARRRKRQAVSGSPNSSASHC